MSESEKKNGKGVIELTGTLPTPKTPEAMFVMERMHTIMGAVHGSVERMQFAGSVIAELNKLGTRCNKRSVIISTFNLAVMGLVPGAAYGHAWFVPYTFKRGTPDEVTVCQVQIGYHGFLDLAFGNQFLKDCHAEVIFEGEEFKFWNTSAGPQVDHDLTPRMDGEIEQTFGKVKGAYCIYHTTVGGHGVVTVGKQELKKLWSKAGSKSVWKTDPIPMCLKTPIRRSSKFWKKTRQMAAAVMLDEQHETDRLQTSLVADAAADEKTLNPADFIADDETGVEAEDQSVVDAVPQT